MIQIVLLLLLFLVYVYVSMNRKEGLKDFEPLNIDRTVFGVNVIKDHPENIYKVLTNPKHSLKLYQPRFDRYNRSDVIIDMQYFNNASNILKRYMSVL